MSIYRRALRKSEQKHGDAEEAVDGDFLFSAAECREFVDNGRDNRLDHGELAISAEHEQHQEEQDRPQRRHRHHRQSFRIRHER